MDGGWGNDIIYGGSGADSFTFIQGDGVDQIMDFQDGLDKLYLNRTGLQFSDLTIASVGSDTQVTYGVGDSFTLVGIASHLIGVDDFQFV